MSQNQEILDKVVAIVASVTAVPADTIKPETRFDEDLGGDSLDRVEICLDVSDEFDFEMSDDEMESFATVGGLIDVIIKHVDPEEDSR